MTTKKAVAGHTDLRSARLVQVSAGREHPILIHDAANILYLTGFRGSHAYLVVGGGLCVFITDGRYAESAEAILPKEIRLVVQKGRLRDVLKDIGFGKRGRTSLALEAESFTLQEAAELKEALPELSFVSVSSPVLEMRTRKDRQEIASIRSALRLTEEAMVYLAGIIKPGMSERSAAVELEYYCKAKGAEEMAFPTILASGPRSSMPHAGVSDAAIPANALIQLDFGIKMNGYCSDFSRVLYTGKKLPAVMRTAWAKVVEAQQIGIDVIHAGIASSVPDDAVRVFFKKKRVLGKYTHSLGHGLGLDVHESPRLSRFAPVDLEIGNVVTVEPGLYFPGKWGIRIEDIVVVRSRGAEILTDFPREIACIG